MKFLNKKYLKYIKTIIWLTVLSQVFLLHFSTQAQKKVFKVMSDPQFFNLDQYVEALIKPITLHYQNLIKNSAQKSVDSNKNSVRLYFHSHTSQSLACGGVSLRVTFQKRKYSELYFQFQCDNKSQSAWISLKLGSLINNKTTLLPQATLSYLLEYNQFPKPSEYDYYELTTDFQNTKIISSLQSSQGHLEDQNNQTLFNQIVKEELTNENITLLIEHQIFYTHKQYDMWIVPSTSQIPPKPSSEESLKNQNGPKKLIIDEYKDNNGQAFQILSYLFSDTQAIPQKATTEVKSLLQLNALEFTIGSHFNFD